MTRLERARRFLIGRSRVLTLRVISIAAVAVAGAYAQDPQFVLDSQNFSTTVPTQVQSATLCSGTCTTPGTFGFDGLFATSYPPGLDVNGYQGISLTNSISVSCLGSGGLSGVCGGETFDLNFQGHIAGSAPFPALGNLAYDFNVGNSNFASEGFNYSVVGNSGSSPYNEDVINNGTFTINPDGTWSADLFITPDTFNEGDSMSVTFPGGASLDFTAVAAPTPEPASLALAAGGLGLAAWFRRRRKA